MLRNVERPCSMAWTIVAKSSSRRTRSADFASDVGPRAAHGDADVRLVERRPVVDAVSGHRHDVAASSQHPGDAQLRLRADAGDDDAVAIDQRTEDLVVHGEVVPAQEWLSVDAAARLRGRWPRQSRGGRR